MRVFLKGVGSLILLVAVLVGLVAVLAFLARDLGHLVLHGVDPTVAAAAVAGASTVIVSVATLVMGRVFERRKAIEAEMRERKIPVYSRLVSGLMGMLLEGNRSDQSTNAENLFRELTPELMTWASDNVLVAWSRFKRGIGDNPSEEAVFNFEKVLMAIRKDYGHGGKGVAEGDLLGLFINDIDEQLARRNRAIPPNEGPTTGSQ